MRVLPRRGGASTRPGGVRGVALLMVTLFGVLTLWATLTPPFSTVDEPRHFNSVLRLAQGGGWPPPQTAPMLEGTTRAAAESREGVAPQERSSALALDAPDYDTVKPDWMTQHPPTYYAVTAVAVRAVDLLTPGEQRWDQTMLVMRLVSCLMTVAAVPFIARSVKLVTGSDPAALVGTSIVLLLPQLFNIHSLVTNDSLVMLLGAVLMWACVRAYTRPKTLLSSAVVGGLALGVGLLTKGLMLPAVPVLALFLLLAGRRAGSGWRTRFWIPLLGGVIAFVIGGWWWVRNIVVYGQIQSSNYGDNRGEGVYEGYSHLGFAEIAVGRLIRTFWSSIPPTLFYDAWVPLLLTALLLVVVATALVWSRHRGLLLLTAVYPALVAALFTYNAWQVYLNFGVIAGIQGRYLYSGMVFFALALGLAWQEVARRVGPAAGIVVAALVMTWAAVTIAASYLFAFRVQWVPRAESWRDRYTAMVDVTALPAWAHVAVVLLTAAAGLALAVTVLRSAAAREVPA